MDVLKKLKGDYFMKKLLKPKNYDSFNSVYGYEIAGGEPFIVYQNSYVTVWANKWCNYPYQTKCLLQPGSYCHWHPEGFPRDCC